MSVRLEITLRIIISSLVGAALGFGIMKIGDIVIPVAPPSLIFTGGVYTWTVGMPWWMSAGAIIGICADLGMIRTRAVNTFPIGLFIALLGILEVVAWSTYQRFVFSGDPLNSASYFAAFATNLILFLLMTFIPIILTVTLGQWLINRSAKHRSAFVIMPNELRERLEREQAINKQTPFLQRIFDRTKKST
jgi:ribose/xylose/arabinose/galactoside ABC-type transport system permease subunit